jgi:hypothetical protein
VAASCAESAGDEGTGSVESSAVDKVCDAVSGSLPEGVNTLFENRDRSG